jgi:hypothetical protein
MTDPTMALRALLEKSSDTELLREMVGFTAQQHHGGYFPAFLEPAVWLKRR